MAHPNEDIVRGGYAAFESGDMDALRTYLSPDVIWHQPGDNPTSGDYKGIDEALGHFGDIIQRTAGNFRVNIHDVLANDSHAVVLGHVHAERGGGKVLDQDYLHVFHLTDGKATESWIHNTDQAADDEFWN